MPTALALLLAAYPPRRRTGAVAASGVAAGVASALGPTLGGVLVDRGDWRLIFLVNVPLGLTLSWVGRRVLPAPERLRQPAARRLGDRPAGDRHRPRRPRARARSRVGLDRRARARQPRARLRAAAGLRASLQPPSGAGARARAAARARGRRGECCDDDLRRRDLRQAALRRPVPDERLGLHGARGGPGDEPEPAGHGADRRPRGAARRPPRGAARRRRAARSSTRPAARPTRSRCRPNRRSSRTSCP